MHVCFTELINEKKNPSSDFNIFYAICTRLHKNEKRNFYVSISGKLWWFQSISTNVCANINKHILHTIYYFFISILSYIWGKSIKIYEYITPFLLRHSALYYIIYYIPCRHSV